jgi:hypothetical protein
MPPFSFAANPVGKSSALAKFFGTNGRQWRWRDVKGVSEEKSEETNLTKRRPPHLKAVRGAFAYGKHDRWRTANTAPSGKAAIEA